MWLSEYTEGFTDYPLWEMFILSVFGWIMREIILPIVFNPIRSACKYLFLMLLKPFIPNAGDMEEFKRQLAQGWAAFVSNPKQETFELIDVIKASTVAFFVFVVQKFWPGDAAQDLTDTDSESEQDVAPEPVQESGSSSSNSPYIATVRVRGNVQRTVQPPRSATAIAADRQIQPNAPIYARFWRHILYNWKVGDWRTKAVYVITLYCVLSFFTLFIVQMIGNYAIVKNIDTQWDACESSRKRDRDVGKIPITDEDIRRICGDLFETDYITADKNTRITHNLWTAFWSFPILGKLRRVLVRTISQMTEQDGVVLGLILPFIVLPIVIYQLARMVLLPATTPAKRKKVC